MKTPQLKLDRAKMRRAMNPRYRLSDAEIDHVKELLLTDPFDGSWSPKWVARLIATVEYHRNAK